MSREKYTDDYEDFEPENAVWPYFLLSFLIPLIPFVMNIVLGNDGGFTVILLFEYITSFLPLFCTAVSIRDGEKAWTLLLSSSLYFAFVLFKWAEARLTGGTAPVFAFSASPSLLPLIAFTFFKKRKRNNWLGWALIGVILSSVFLFFSWRVFTFDNPVMLIYPALILFLAFTPFFVTRRTESTPLFVAILLILLVFASFTFYPGLTETFLSGTLSEKLSVTLRCFLNSFVLWYTLSFLFVFSGLAGKSSYKRVIDDSNDDTDTEKIVVPPSDTPSPRYTTPPPYSRFDSQGEKKQNVDERMEAPSKKTEAPNREDKTSFREDDKWYNFIEGGISSDNGGRRREDDAYDRRRDDDYYRERDRRGYYDERGSRRDDRSRERYDDERRRYRDDRDYYPRERRDYYDDRDYYLQRRSDSDRDYYRDRDRRYYDDDYRDYHDDDRRR